MSNRCQTTLFGVGSLLTGGISYLLFRPNTYIAKFFAFLPLEAARSFLQSAKIGRLVFWTSDFLWGFSLTCLLLGLLAPRRSGALLCAAVTVVCGVLWEIMQYVGMVGGTGDVWDMVMYLLAAALAVVIYLKEKSK